MNKTVAFIGLGAAVCMTAPHLPDTHLSLTKESVASMHEITAALDKVTDEPRSGGRRENGQKGA